MIDAPGVFLAFAAGLVSFLSPCCLPLVPGFLATVAGAGPDRELRRFDIEVMSRSLLFVATFSTIFILLGLGATVAGAFLFDNQILLNKLAGVAIVAMGIFFLASLVVPKLNVELRFANLTERAGRGGPVVAGAAFALAWTPCVGPTLGAILTLASTAEGTSKGAALLAVYSAGLGLPFLFFAAAYSTASRSFTWVRKHRAAVQVVSGSILVVMGLLVFSGELFRLNIEAQKLLERLGLNIFKSV